MAFLGGGEVGVESRSRNTQVRASAFGHCDMGTVNHQQTLIAKGAKPREFRAELAFPAEGLEIDGEITHQAASIMAPRRRSLAERARPFTVAKRPALTARE